MPSSLHNNFCAIVGEACKCFALMDYMPSQPMKTVSYPHQLYPAAGAARSYAWLMMHHGLVQTI